MRLNAVSCRPLGAPRSPEGATPGRSPPSTRFLAYKRSPPHSGYFRCVLAQSDCSATIWIETPVAIKRNTVDTTKFNEHVHLPFALRLKDFELALQDGYDFFYDVNRALTQRGLARLDDMLRPAIMSGLLSDMLTVSLAKHSRTLTVNLFHNGHPDLIVNGVYPGNRIQSGVQGVEVKTTRNRGGAVDTHGARDQWMCVFVYDVDNTTEPAVDRSPMRFVEVYLGEVTVDDFRKNARSELGTRTATLHRKGVEKLRRNWVYMVSE